MSTTLTIGGYKVCGIVGKGCEMTISTQDCWLIYHKWVTSLAEPDCPLCVLDNVQWAVNGKVIDKPKAWFITLSNN